MDCTAPVGATRQGPEASCAKVRCLSKLPLFSGLPEKARVQLAEAAVPRSWPHGTLLFQRGDASGKLIVIETGRVRISLRTYAGRELVLQIIDGTAMVGEVGILDGTPHTADATVISPAKGFVIGATRFSGLVAEHPELAWSAVRHLCGVIRRRTDQLEGIALYELDARLSRFFLSALEGGGHVAAQTPGRLLLDLTQSEIADLIACSRPKVNRVLKSLERVGAIRREGRYIVCDRGKLNRVADSITKDVRRMPSRAIS
jgi:CRP/FNR family transcriptional regulator, cyclic AMP receptor protein